MADTNQNANVQPAGIDAILALPTAKEVITALQEKTINVPLWTGKHGLKSQYDPTLHPVMDKGKYPDGMDEDGHPEPVTRITYDLQRLAVKRMTELITGIPPKCIYKPQNDRQKKVAEYLEAIYQRSRIESVNVERLNMLYGGCEFITLWYAVEQKNNLYGFDSDLKLRVRNFSPMLGDDLYPLFDEYGDLIALSVGYKRKVAKKDLFFFDTYTAKKHLKWWSENNNEWTLAEDEDITIGKIPAVYVWRPTPIWEDCSRIVYEMEWSMSRNGNYLRKNSKPLFVLFADEQINFGEEGNENKEFRSILHYPKGSTAQYVTWQQAIENLKFYVNELRNSYFTQLQLPDWSYEKMSQQALSGESRKQLFIDAQMKVKDESGRILEMADRETNVLRAFLKVMLGPGWEADIDGLPVEHVITPFTINDDKDTVNTLVSATGGKAIMSQREAIEEYGHSSDPDKTLQQIKEEEMSDSFELTE